MKPLKVGRWVITRDLQSIYDYHVVRSAPKAERILEEYDRTIARLEINPLLFHRRSGDWRVYPFDSGTYLPYYIELENFWLVAGIFHANREPAWITQRLLERSE